MKVSRTARRAAPLAALLTIWLTGCATPIQPAITGYTCCNLHEHRDWVSSENEQVGEVIPFGTPVKFTTIKKKFYVYGMSGERDISLSDDLGKTEADTLRWARSLVVAEDPQKKAAGWPSDIRNALQLGRVMVGMTREQVLISLAYPPRNATPDLNSDTWRYWTAHSDSPVELVFDKQGVLKRIDGAPPAVRSLEMLR